MELKMVDWLTIGPCKVACGDCLEILPTLESGSVDAVVTDPPYGISYLKGRSGRDGAYRGKVSVADSRGNERIIGDDAVFDPSPLLAFENVLLFGANHFCKRLPDRGRWIAWNKLGSIEPFDSFSDVEFAWHSIGKKSSICNFMWKGGVACVKKGEDNGRRVHPTQKPVGLMTWCIEQTKVDSGATILDPFMGSGTTGVACLRTGRQFVGIERNPEYFRIACERLNREWQSKKTEIAFEKPPTETQRELTTA